MKISETLSQFLNLCRDCQSGYKFNSEIVEKCNKKTTDFLHTLELDKHTYAERAKLTTQEKRNLDERREAKDIMEEYEALFEFLSTQKGSEAINQLREVLGKIRKAESYHANRTYRKRNPSPTK